VSIDFMELMFGAESDADRKVVLQLMSDELGGAWVKPLQSQVFEPSQVKQAFEAAADSQDKKVLIKFREEKNDQHSSLPVHAVRDVRIKADKSYVIIGGTAGFGLDLAEWLVTKGCRNLVLTGSQQTSNLLNHQLISWRGRGVKVQVSQDKLVSADVTRNVINLARQMGPVGGVLFATRINKTSDLGNSKSKDVDDVMNNVIVPMSHLNTVLQDNSFSSSLDLFVTFTSLAGSRGQSKQAISAFANCFIDRICMKMFSQGIPAKSVQLGSVSDVLLPAPWWDGGSQCGTAPQSTQSCLRTLDLLLATPSAVTCSYVIPSTDSDEQGVLAKMSKVERLVANTLGLDSFADFPQETLLSDLGVDSVAGMELQRLFEREFKLVITPDQFTTLTLADFWKIENKTFVPAS